MLIKRRLLVSPKKRRETKKSERLTEEIAAPLLQDFLLLRVLWLK
jgi:hypothetical protein